MAVVINNKVANIPSGSGGGAVDSVNAKTGTVILNQDDIADGVTNKQYPSSDKTKLAGIAAGATLNSPDATLLSRTNHTGTQTAATISDFSAASDARISNARGAADGIAPLGPDSKVPTTYLPALALTDTFVVADQTAQLALVAEEGDVAVRTDINKSYIHNGGVAGSMADWQELLTPTDTVLSVNGFTGSVSLDTSSVSEGSNLYFTNERAQDALGSISGNTDTVTITYDDITPSLKADARTQMSVTSDVSGLKLSGDVTAPGNSKLYGTNASGVRGWYDQPAGGGGGGAENLPHYTPDFHTDWRSMYSDFPGGTVGSFTVNAVSGTGANGGASFTTAGPITFNASGVIQLSTGTTATGYGGRALISGAGVLGFKNGTEYFLGTRLYNNTAPDATNDFFVFVGFISLSSSVPTTTNNTAGIYYDRTFTNWQALKVVGGTASYIDTGVPFVINAWCDIGIKATGNDTETAVALNYYINGNLVVSDTGVHDVSTLKNFIYRINKTAGTSARLLYIDHEFFATRNTA